MQNQAKFSLLFFSDEPKKGRNNIFCQKITIDNLTKSNSRLELCLHQGWPLRGPRAACGPQHLFKEKINRLFLKILREFARQYFD